MGEHCSAMPTDTFDEHQVHTILAAVKQLQETIDGTPLEPRKTYTEAEVRAQIAAEVAPVQNDLERARKRIRDEVAQNTQIAQKVIKVDAQNLELNAMPPQQTNRAPRSVTNTKKINKKLANLKKRNRR